MCWAGPGSKARAWAGLLRAWAGLGLGPGLYTDIAFVSQMRQPQNLTASSWLLALHKSMGGFFFSIGIHFKWSFTLFGP